MRSCATSNQSLTATSLPVNERNSSILVISLAGINFLLGGYVAQSRAILKRRGRPYKTLLFDTVRKGGVGFAGSHSGSTSIQPKKGRFMMKRLVCVLCALACAAVLAVIAMAQGANVTGDWDVTFTTPQGPLTAKFTFKQEGEKLTGTIKTQFGDAPLEGAVKGKEINFKYAVKVQDQDYTITLSGAVDGDLVKGRFDFGGTVQGDWNAKRASAATASGAAPAAAEQSSGNKGGDKIDVTGAWNVTVETDAG